jgi:hypothetical protein
VILAKTTTSVATVQGSYEGTTPRATVQRLRRISRGILAPLLPSIGHNSYQPRRSSFPLGRGHAGCEAEAKVRAEDTEATACNQPTIEDGLFDV